MLFNTLKSSSQSKPFLERMWNQKSVFSSSFYSEYIRLKWGACNYISCHFTPGERAPSTHWIGGWVGPRPVLKAENSWFYLDSNSDPSVVQPVASRYTDCAIPAPGKFINSSWISITIYIQISEELMNYSVYANACHCRLYTPSSRVIIRKRLQTFARKCLSVEAHLLVVLLITWVYLPVCFDFLQTGDERWLYGWGDWLLSQSVKWKNVLLKGSPQWRSPLDEQVQHLSPVPVNTTTTYPYKIWAFHDCEDIDCRILSYDTV
jgi:hypothetical protein